MVRFKRVKKIHWKNLYLVFWEVPDHPLPSVFFAGAADRATSIQMLSVRCGQQTAILASQRLEMFTYLDLGRPHSSLFNIDKHFGNVVFSLLFWSISLWAPTDWLDNVQVCPQKITGCKEGEVRPARIFYQFVIFLLFSCNQIWPLFYVWYSHANTPCKNILNIWSIFDCLCSHTPAREVRTAWTFSQTQFWTHLHTSWSTK